MTITPPASQTTDFNFDWRFALEDDEVFSQCEFADTAWRQLRLPHDWSVEFSFDPVHGNGATGYLPGGIGWYRKHFETHQSDDQLAFILFDGVYNNCDVWCNGHLLGRNPYGYSPFWFELTPHLLPANDKQVIAVRVDHSRFVDSRWYTGSGIYRDVKLITKSKLHIPIWGTYLTTPEITESSATIELEITVKNAFANARNGLVRTIILNPQHAEVASIETPFALGAQQDIRCKQIFEISEPALWHTDHPNLYRAVSYVLTDETLHEIYETPFGIRSCRFDPDQGFFLNGENMLIKGVCLHHDGGLVGAAVPDGVWRRRLAILKDAGCNAIRIAHNPSSEPFLNLCDEMGFLVQAEFFDEWDYPKDKRLNNRERHDDYVSRGYAEHFQEWAESDLKRTMQRDRNHPCVFQWSIGNEIEWTYPRYAQATGYFEPEFEGNYFHALPPYSWEKIKARFDALPAPEYPLAETAHKLAQWTREMDTSRPVIANCILPSTSHVTGFTDALDVVGYSYRQPIYDIGHATYPDKAIIGAENVGQWHEWKQVIERSFISGMFIWTGINYMGEAHDKWPAKALGTGLLDLAGFLRAPYYMFKSLWSDEPAIHLTTQIMGKSPYRVSDEGAVIEKEPGSWHRKVWFWHDVNAHWNYDHDEPIVVEIFTNCDKVELFLNGQSLGPQLLQNQPDRIMKWRVPFAVGTLEAHGTYQDGQTVVTRLITAAAPTAIQLTVDELSLAANDYDVAHVIAQLVDTHNVPVKHVEQEIIFSVNGACHVLGVDNGSEQNVQDYQSDRLITSQGRALLVLQAKHKAGSISVQVVSEGISNMIEIIVS